MTDTGDRDMIYTTLNKIRANSPCESGWRKLLKHLGKTESDDDPLLLLTILESNGLDDTLWCLRTVPEHNLLWRLYAVWCARQVQHLMTDQRSINALDVVERHANGKATDTELDAAGAAAEAAQESRLRELLSTISWSKTMTPEELAAQIRGWTNAITLGLFRFAVIAAACKYIFGN